MCAKCMWGGLYDARHAHDTVGDAAVFQNRAELLCDAVSESPLHTMVLFCNVGATNSGATAYEVTYFIWCAFIILGDVL